MPASPADPVITFMSDYGLSDDFVGVCHGVIATACPAARVIDLTHGIPRHDVRAGAIVLAQGLPYLPVAVHLAVVDPGVGGERRAVALRLADERVLVGPDNGLLWLAAQAGDGVAEAIDIGRSGFRLLPVSATFHGRDIFAPVAAALAAGARFADTGDPIDPASLVRLTLRSPQVRDGTVVAHVHRIDGFGNLQLDVGADELDAIGLRRGELAVIGLPDGAQHTAGFVRAFTDAAAGGLLLFEDSARRMAIAVSHGDAAQRLALAPEDELRIRSA